MRTGIFFFFNMGHVTKVTRLLLAILVTVMVIRSTVTSSESFMTLFYVTLVISLIPAPSDKAMLRRLEGFYDETVKRAGETCDLLHYDIVVLFKSFLHTGRFHFCRRLGTRWIYMHAASAAFVEKSGKKFLVIGTKSLVSAHPAKFYTVDLVAEPDLRITSRDEDEDTVEVLFESKSLPRGLVFLTQRNDYRYRDFMEAMKEYVK